MSLCYPDTAVWARPPVADPVTDESVAAQLAADDAEAFAWYALQSLTAYQLAICPTTVRPCKKACREGSYYLANTGLPFAPKILPSGAWINVWCGCQDACSCTTVEEIVLPGPVGSIVEIMIDGVVLDPTAYRVDNGNRLVRQDGGEWPTCQDMNLPAGEVGTFTVTYFQGFTANSMTNRVAGELAKEFYLALTGGQKCRLSSRVTGLTRQGVSFELAVGLFSNGYTGLPTVDAYIATLNPFALKTRPVIASPDSIARRPRVTTAGHR